MSGSVHHSMVTSAKFKIFTVFRKMDGKICFGIRTVDNIRTGCLVKVEVTAYKICVKMCFKNVLYGGFLLGGKVKVFFNISEGVDYGGFSVAFDIVRSFAKATGIQVV